MTGDKDRQTIRKAMAYRSGEDSIGSVYMGGLAISGLYATLGVPYGKSGFDAALDTASRQQLDSVVLQCKSIIDYMQKHPREKCPCCGQITPRKRTESR